MKKENEDAYRQREILTRNKVSGSEVRVGEEVVAPECGRLLVLLGLELRAVDDAVTESTAVAAADLAAGSHQLVQRVHREAGLRASERRHERRQLLARLQ